MRHHPMVSGCREGEPRKQKQGSKAGVRSLICASHPINRTVSALRAPTAGYRTRYAARVTPMRFIQILLLVILPVGSFATEKGCPMNDPQEAVVTKLFSGEDHIYSLLWWSDPDSKIINARSFILSGHDSVPIFSSEAEGRAQVAGSAYEKDLVSIDPGLLAAILQEGEYAILNPGGSNPIQFRTCILKPFIKFGGA